MKVTNSSDGMKVDMSFDEWVRVGSSKGWVKKSSVHDEPRKAVYSEKMAGMLKTASVAAPHDVSGLPHLVLLNSGSDIPAFAEALADAIGRNKSMPATRIIQLDVSLASRRDPDVLKKSVASLMTAPNTVWKVISSASPSMDLIKLFADNSSGMQRSNTWVVFETQD